MASKPQSSVVFQPLARRGFQRGAGQLAALIRPTLGPHARTVAVERTISSYSPDLLDDGGVLARRVIQLADRDGDTGAMFLRHVLWSTHERVGDGVATTAVLFQSVFDAGARYLAAGGDAMRLRRHLEGGLRALLGELEHMAAPLCGRAQLAQLCESVCHDAELAGALGEIFDIVGADGRLDIRAGRGRAIEREYVEGRYWPAATLSPALLHELPGATLRLEHAGVVLADCAIDDPADVAAVLRLALTAGHQSLLIVAQSISERALTYLLSQRAAMPAAVARVPGVGAIEQIAALDDMALLTGARPVVGAAGQRLRAMRAEDLGQTQRAWADQHNMGIAGGAADARRLRSRVAQLRAAWEAERRPREREQIQGRIGRLLGGSAVLWVGGATESEITHRSALAERAARALRSALRCGVLPGGGSALLASAPMLQSCHDAACDADERTAYAILLHAIEAPFRVLAANAGYEPSAMLARVRMAGAGAGFDIRIGEVADMRAAGVVDSAGVLIEALRSAISSAALALTIDVIIHPSAPVTATEP